MQIYLDYSATTPTHPQVIERVATILQHHWGNPSSLHTWGQDTATLIEMAREQVAGLINANPDQIIFTSGGTEADNLAIIGVAQHYNRPRHIIISSVEHSAIAEPCKQLEQQGWQITRLPVNRQGRVNPLDLKAAIQSDTVLISIIYGQSEVGTLQPIEELGSIARERGVLFHTDAVQVAAYLEIDVNELQVDLMALSAHKFYGPKGVGVLYVRDGTPYLPTLTGGGHERGRRAGTVNVAGAAGAAAALQHVSRERRAQSARLRALRDRMIAGVLAATPGVQLTGHPQERLPGHASFLFHGVDGETLLMALDVEGIAVSTGSACASGDPEPSPVLTAMGIAREWSLGGLRISLGYHNTEADVDALLATLPGCVERVRRAALEML